MNSEGHYLVVKSVANYSDSHYILPQISLPGSDLHYSFSTVIHFKIFSGGREAPGPLDWCGFIVSYQPPYPKTSSYATLLSVIVYNITRNVIFNLE